MKNLSELVSVSHRNWIVWSVCGIFGSNSSDFINFLLFRYFTNLQIFVYIILLINDINTYTLVPEITNRFMNKFIYNFLESRCLLISRTYRGKYLFFSILRMLWQHLILFRLQKLLTILRMSVFDAVSFQLHLECYFYINRKMLYLNRLTILAGTSCVS